MNLFKPSKKLFLALSSLMLLGFSFTAQATPCVAYAYAQPICNPWHFSFSPYGWLTSINGDVTIRDVNQNVNIPFSQIWHNLDGAGEFHFEGGYGPWTLMIDPTYMRVSEDFTNDATRSSFETTTLLVDAGVFYKIWCSQPCAAHPTSVEVLAGGRYFGLDNDLDFDAAPELNVRSNTRLTAPIIGGRIKYDVTPCTHLWLRGDVGGFGVDDVRSTWSATAGLAYTLFTNFDVGVAYRVLNINFSQPHSSENLTIHGPMVGVSFYI